MNLHRRGEDRVVGRAGPREELAYGWSDATLPAMVLESPSPRLVVAAGRRTGKSLALALRAIQLAHDVPGSRTAFVTLDGFNRGSLQARVIEWAYQSNIVAVRSGYALTFPGGSSVDFLIASQLDRIRGERFNHLLVDEADYIEPSVYDDLYFLMQGCGYVALVSTPHHTGFRAFRYPWMPFSEYERIRYPSDRVLRDEAVNTVSPRYFALQYEARFDIT